MFGTFFSFLTPLLNKFKDSDTYFAGRNSYFEGTEKNINLVSPPEVSGKCRMLLSEFPLVGVPNRVGPNAPNACPARTTRRADTLPEVRLVSGSKL